MRSFFRCWLQNEDHQVWLCCEGQLWSENNSTSLWLYLNQQSALVKGIIRNSELLEFCHLKRYEWCKVNFCIPLLFGESAQIPLNQSGSHTKRNPKSSTPYFTSNETLQQCLGPLWVELYLFLRYLGEAFLGNWVQTPQIMCKDTHKIIQSFQLLVSHQMRHCSSVRALCGLSYSRFTGSQVVGQFGETGYKYPKSHAGTHEN